MHSIKELDMSKTFILGILQVVFIRNSGEYGEILYKLYNIDDKSFYITKGFDKDKPYNKKMYRSNEITCTIKTTLSEEELEEYLYSNEKIPVDNDLYSYNICTTCTSLRNRYNIIGKSEDNNYIIGMNFYGKTKAFIKEEVLAYNTNDLSKLHLYYNYNVGYREHLKDYIRGLSVLKIDKKEINKLNKTTKLNDILAVTGCNYTIGKNGKIYIKDANVVTDIVMKEFPYKTIVIEGCKENIRQFKINSGPELVCSSGLSEMKCLHGYIEVVMPKTLKKIDYNGFYNSDIQEIDISKCEELEVINSCAFSRTSLTGLTIPDSVNKIGDRLVSHCSFLEYLILPRHIDYFKYNWIEGCISLKTLVLPEDKITRVDTKCEYILGTLTELTEIWTSENNVKLAKDLACKIKREKDRVYEYNMKWGNRKYQYNDRIPKVIIVRRK